MLLNSLSANTLQTSTVTDNSVQLGNSTLQSKQHSQRTPKEHYDHVLQNIQNLYQAFDPSIEQGAQNRPGITADIDFITKADLIGVLEHIRSDETLLKESCKQSAKAQFFDKLYLMSDPDQGWNLRLHRFNLQGNGLGGEDSPHYHRWTLASRVLAGGYLNVNYQEKTVDQAHLPEEEYSKYRLAASKQQTGGSVREAHYLGQAVMQPTSKTLYGKGDLNHFPIETPHSVQTQSDYMGTTLTLAHTSKAAKEHSISFKTEAGLTSLPEERLADKNDIIGFKKTLDYQIAHLQILELSDQLNLHLNEKQLRGEALLPGEEKHLRDYKEFNYIETSLLPALAIFKLESDNGVEHQEFSASTANLLNQHLQKIDASPLSELTEDNQGDLWA